MASSVIYVGDSTRTLITAIVRQKGTNYHCSSNMHGSIYMMVAIAQSLFRVPSTEDQHVVACTDQCTEHHHFTHSLRVKASSPLHTVAPCAGPTVLAISVDGRFRMYAPCVELKPVVQVVSWTLTTRQRDPLPSAAIPDACMVSVS